MESKEAVHHEKKILPEHDIGGWVHFDPEHFDQENTTRDADDKPDNDQDEDESVTMTSFELGDRHYVRKTITDTDKAIETLEKSRVLIRRLTTFSGDYTFYAGRMFNEVIAHDGLRYWQLAELSPDGPQEYLPDGTQIEAPSQYKWRLGSNGLPLPIFNGARIKCSKKSRRVKKAASNSAGVSSTSSASSRPGHSRSVKFKKRHHIPSFDFFFDSNGEILKVSGDKLSYHWHLFDSENNPVEWKDVNGEPGKLVFRHDGKILNLQGVEQDFKWMYIHSDGHLLDPAYEDGTPVVVFPADGTIGMRLLTNPDGSIFISKFGKPVLIVDDELDIYGPGGNKILIYNDEDEYTDPDGKPLEIGKPVIGPDGNPVMMVESLEENSKRNGVQIPEVHYSGFNVKVDKWGNIIAGNPIILDPNGPPVLLIKYTTVKRLKKPQETILGIQKEKPFIERSDYLPFWIIDPDGKLIVLHDKDGLLWDRHFKPYKPTGSGQEPNGDVYDYYIFSGNRRPCDRHSVCFHPEILDSTDEDEDVDEHTHTTLDLSQLKKIFNYHEDLYGKSNVALFKCFEFPKCLKDGSYQKYLVSLCQDTMRTEKKMEEEHKILESLLEKF